MDRLIREQTVVDGKLIYSSNISQILALRGFIVKVMVWKGKTRPHIIGRSVRTSLEECSDFPGNQ